MKVMVTARHFDLDPELKRYVEEKVEHLTRYFDRIDEAHVVLDVEGHRRIADVTVHASRLIVSSEQEAEDMRSAIDRALEKVERQIRRHKGRIRNRKGATPTAEAAKELDGMAPEAVGIGAEQLGASPMSPEEALASLDELNVGFLVFLNSDTKKLNVVYRRDDGDFGLVEPKG